MIQWAILISSAASIYLLSKNNKYAHPIGFIAQFFWVYSTIMNKQWGMLALSGFYLWIYGEGIYKNFIKNGY